MPDLNTKVCDRCGKIKQEANHWWVIFYNMDTQSMIICPLGIRDESKIFHGYDIESSYHMLYACGLDCLAILESKIKHGENPIK